MELTASTTILRYILIIILSSILSVYASGQDASGLADLPAFINKTASRVSGLQSALDKKTNRLLQKFRKSEENLYRKWVKKDSVKAAEYLAASRKEYEALSGKLKNAKLSRSYIPYLDTLSTSVDFLNQPSLLQKANAPDIQELKNKVGSLQSSFNGAEEIRKFIQRRKQHLKYQLLNTPLAAQLKTFQKQAYYYSTQVNEYKQALKDRSKAEKKIMELLSKSKPWKDFMRRNSHLASMFRLPGSDNEIPASFAGLQTRNQVNALIRQRIGSDPAALSRVRDNIQSAQAQLNTLKQKALAYKNGSFGSDHDFDLPGNFKPNTQKTKSFFNRLEFGANIQTQKAKLFFPITTDLAFSVGYKLNDKSILGIGSSYKLGLGTGWQNIEFSTQGMSIRSFFDYKIKGSLFLSGGYEQNYKAELNDLSATAMQNIPTPVSSWQQSGLLGLSKKYKINKKLNGEIKLLWDFLSYRQVPASQPVLFRIGYTFK